MNPNAQSHLAPIKTVLTIILIQMLAVACSSKLKSKTEEGVPAARVEEKSVSLCPDLEGVWSISGGGGVYFSQSEEGGLQMLSSKWNENIKFDGGQQTLSDRKHELYASAVIVDARCEEGRLVIDYERVVDLAADKWTEVWIADLEKDLIDIKVIYENRPDKAEKLTATRYYPSATAHE